jgi:hypothetical protein
LLGMVLGYFPEFEPRSCPVLQRSLAINLRCIVLKKYPTPLPAPMRYAVRLALGIPSFITIAETNGCRHWLGLMRDPLLLFDRPMS